MAHYVEGEDFIPPWESTFADPNVPIPIPEEERAPEDCSDTLRFQTWMSRGDVEHVPDLKRRSLQEVEAEAVRIKLGEYFTRFRDFQRCLDSWSVLNGRVAAKYKTRRKEWVRVCRFSGLARTSSRLADGESLDPDDPVVASGLQDCSHIAAQVQEDLLQCDSDSEGSNGFEMERTDTIISHENALFTNGHAPVSLLPLQENVPLAQPLGDLCVNIFSHNVARLDSQLSTHVDVTQNLCGVLGDKENSAPPGQPLDQPLGRSRPKPGERRSIVRHTRVWIPDSFAPVPGAPTRQRKRTVPQSGACGQLARFLPAIPNDSEQQNLNCPFRVRCSRLTNTCQFKITICELKHTCPRYKHKWRGPSQKAKWLGETLAPWVVRNVKVPSRELQTGFQMDYKKTANLQQLWRAKDLVRDWWAGGQRRSFHQIPALLDRVKEVDPSAVVEWETQPFSKIFKRAFVCPSATRTALSYCQPVISLYACHTKNRKYPTQLFVASVLGGNSRVLILCYALAPVENGDNWAWFLTLLQRSIFGIEDPIVPFVSDRQKGLIKAVADVLHGKVHAHCSHHLQANVKNRYGQAAGEFFIQCVYASNKKYFDKILLQLMKLVAKGDAAVEYIKTIEPKNYARHAFPLPRFGKIKRNPCEQANAGLLVIREFAPFRLMVELWLYIQKQFCLRYAAAMASDELLTKQARERFNENLRNHQQWSVDDDGHDEAKVQIIDMSEEYLVSLLPKPKCSCQELQEMCWPCEHIMAWDDKDGRDYNRHFHTCWRVASLRNLYEARVPCFLSNEVDITNSCFPPEPAVKKGRHRVVQIVSGARTSSLRSEISQKLGEDEFMDSQGNLFFRYPIADDPEQLEAMPIEHRQTLENHPGKKIGRRSNPNGGRRKCSLCGSTGHNKRTCAIRSGSDQQTASAPPSNNAEADLISKNEVEMKREDENVPEQVSQFIRSSAPGPDLCGTLENGYEDELSTGEEERISDISTWPEIASYTAAELERWISFATG